MRRVVWILPAVAGVVPAGAASEGRPCGPVTLTEASAELAVDFVHDRGARGDKHLPETMGSGLAWLDFDGDGWTDLFLVQSGPYPWRSGVSAHRLYRNLEGGRFEPVAASALPEQAAYGQGVVAADIEGDGDVDLYLTNVGADVLWLNQGDGRFGEAGPGVGLDAGGWSSSAALADMDGDGDLDLYVTRYVSYDDSAAPYCGDADAGERTYCDPTIFSGEEDLLYRNLDDGRFERVDAGWLTGPDASRTLAGRGLGVVFTDLDADGQPDLYVANDLSFNGVFRNLGGGRFEDVALRSGGAVNGSGQLEAGMGIAVGRTDSATALDLLVTNFDAETNTHYRVSGLAGRGGPSFADVSVHRGLGPPSLNSLAFGVVMQDLDLDGRLDAYVANGHVFEAPRRSTSTYRQPDQIFVGGPDGRFAAARCERLGRGPTVSRGAAWADLDNDGDPDLAVQENGGPASVLRNDSVAGAEGRWLGTRLLGAAANSEAIGSEVTLTAGGESAFRLVLAGDSYQSSSDRRALFGLGGRRPEALEVRWTSGGRSRWLDPPADRYLILPEPKRPAR